MLMRNRSVRLCFGLFPLEPSSEQPKLDLQLRRKVENVRIRNRLPRFIRLVS
jgi:hypothetical protein